MATVSLRRRRFLLFLALLAPILALVLSMRSSSATRAFSNIFQTARFPALRITATSSRPFTSASVLRTSFNMDPSKMSTSEFMQTVAMRRSVYSLNSNSPISDKRIQDLTYQTLRGVPSAFNSQSTRIVVLVKAEHRKFWDMTKETFLADIEDEEAKKSLGGKLEGYKNAYGSILFFENETTIKGYQEKAPAYSEQFPLWAEHTSGMHQYVLWTAFTAEGLGCNLQHYHTNPKVEGKTKEMWDLPKEWQLKAQLVFGGVEEGGRPTHQKDKIPVDQTSRFYGADV